MTFYVVIYSFIFSWIIGKVYFLKKRRSNCTYNHGNETAWERDLKVSNIQRNRYVTFTPSSFPKHFPNLSVTHFLTSSQFPYHPPISLNGLRRRFPSHRLVLFLSTTPRAHAPSPTRPNLYQLLLPPSSHIRRLRTRPEQIRTRSPDPAQTNLRCSQLQETQMQLRGVRVGKRIVPRG